MNLYIYGQPAARRNLPKCILVFNYGVMKLLNIQNNTTGAKLEQMRIDAGLSVSDLATKAGVTRATVYKALRGETVRAATLGKLMTAMRRRGWGSNENCGDSFPVIVAGLESLADHLRILATNVPAGVRDKHTNKLVSEAAKQADTIRIQLARISNKMRREE